jgi:energy-coupling factor transporter ATP-binding protein EcfA2
MSWSIVGYQLQVTEAMKLHPCHQTRCTEAVSVMRVLVPVCSAHCSWQCAVWLGMVLLLVYLSPCSADVPGRCLCPAGRDDFGLQNINIGIDMGSRIAIAGPNGAGKTTLMNLLSGERHTPHTNQQHSPSQPLLSAAHQHQLSCKALAAAAVLEALLSTQLATPRFTPLPQSLKHHPQLPTRTPLIHHPLPPPPPGDLEPTAGESRRSHKLRIGRYNQHFVDALAFDENPVEYLLNKFPESGLKPEQMRAMLGRFGLSGQHHLTPIVKLSGGCVCGGKTAPLHTHCQAVRCVCLGQAGGWGQLAQVST